VEQLRGLYRRYQNLEEAQFNLNTEFIVKDWIIEHCMSQPEGLKRLLQFLKEAAKTRKREIRARLRIVAAWKRAIRKEVGGLQYHIFHCTAC